MQAGLPNLFIEIDHTKIIYMVGLYDENQNFKVIEKVISNKEGIDKYRSINIELIENVLKKNIQVIEDKLNCVFKDVTLILNASYYSCINISGFKKLNGSRDWFGL